MSRQPTTSTRRHRRSFRSASGPFTSAAGRRDSGLWIEAQDDDYSRPVFYAACKTDDGILIINGWETKADHDAFRRGLRPHLEAVGIGRPDQHEHLSVERLGWD